MTGQIAVTSKGTTLESPVDTHFGRATNFIIVNLNTNEFSAHDNKQNLNAIQGAGIQAAETVSKLGAESLITANVGPKAFKTLKTAGIKVYLFGKGTVAEAVSALKEGKLKEISDANVDSHWA